MFGFVEKIWDTAISCKFHEENNDLPMDFG